MNFQRFDAIHLYSDAFLWFIGIPCVATLCAFFMWQDVIKFIHKIRKTALVTRVVSASDMP